MFTSIHDRSSISCVPTKQRIGHLCVRSLCRANPKGSTIATASLLLHMARRYGGSLWFAGTRIVPSSPFSCRYLDECAFCRSRERMGVENERGFITVASPVMVNSRQCRALLHRSQTSTLGSTGYCTDPQLTGPAASQHSWGTQAVCAQQRLGA